MIRSVALLLALAHPLGNFSINEYVGLTVSPQQVSAVAIVDAAEIPTLQDRPAVDTDGDGTVSAAERATHAARVCASVAAAVRATVDGRGLVWTVGPSTFDYAPGAGGLEVSRLRCSLSAPASVVTGAALAVQNSYLSDRIGWREMTAVGDGVGLDSPLPATSVSKELTDYPRDLLGSPMDVRSGSMRVTAAGAGSAGSVTLTPGGDPVSRWLAGLDRTFADLVGASRFTPAVGLIAVLLALLLGAGHAALPGHGKTILAAYLAGKRGRRRDALAVAGTVTLTHTGGVLALGLILSAGSALAGDRILAWLGLASGVIVLGVGATMLLAIVRRRHHHHDHPHPHSHPHDHPHAHDHRHDDGDVHDGQSSRRGSRLGLAGIGLAGGLVPSPSALIVLLAAIGLGRTGYGVVLVVAYGIGMAATLTGAGLLLLAVQRRLTRTGGHGRWARVSARINAVTPAATAALVLLVGAGLAIRAAAGVL